MNSNRFMFAICITGIAVELALFGWDLSSGDGLLSLFPLCLAAMFGVFLFIEIRIQRMKRKTKELQQSAYDEFMAFLSHLEPDKQSDE